MSNSPFTPEQISQLDQPLDPRRVKHRQGGGGTQLSYLKGHDVIDTANRIFGYGNWGYDLLEVELHSIPGDNGEVIGGFYSARVRLAVAGCVPVTEEGVCAVQEGRNPRAKIDAHDMARKGAITDALKRALRCFGDQFGNSLYDSDLVDGQPRGSVENRPVRSRPEAPANRNGHSEAARPQPQPAAPVAALNPNAPAREAPARPDGATEQQIQAIKRLAARQNLDESALEARIQQMYGCKLADLTRTEASHFIKVLQGAAA